MKAYVTWFVVALAVGACIWLLVFDAAGRRSDQGDLGSNSARHDGETGERNQRSDTKGSPLNVSLFREAPDLTPTERPWEQPLSSGVRVKVVFQDTGSPLPAAEILFFDPSELTFAQELERGALYGDPEAVLRRFGRRFRADAEGEAWVPKEEWTQVGCGHQGCFGMTSIPAQTRAGTVVKIELAKSPALGARVTTPRGHNAVGVPVSLRYHKAQTVRDMFTSRTGSDGVASFPNIHWLLREILQGREAGTLTVALALPLGNPVEVPLDPDTLPPHPVELTLPETGRVRVKVVDRNGKPATGGIVDLRRHIAEQPVTRGRLVVHQGIGATASIVDGEAQFAHIGLGLELDVLAALDVDSHPSIVTGAGPASSDEQIVFELSMETEPPFLTGRILDPTGAPLATTTLHCWLHEEGAHGRLQRSSLVKTDATGRWTLPMRPDAPPAEVTAWKLELKRVVNKHMLASFERSLPGNLPPGATELGDLRLVETPVLVSGLVIDEVSHPVAGATVGVVRKRDNPWWEPVMNYQCTTDADGRFEMRGELEDPRDLGVYARDPGYALSPTVALTPGDRLMRLTLTRAWTVKGSLLIEPEFRDHVVAHLELPGGPDASDKPLVRRARPTSDGRFEWVGIPACEARFKIALGNRETLLEVSPVHVRPGSATEDPRLQNIDLRGRLSQFKIDVRDVEGATLLPVSVDIVDAQERPFVVDSGWTGPFVITTSAPPVDLRVRKKGFRSVELERVRTDRRITLQPGPAVRLLPTPPIPTLASPYTLELGLKEIPEKGPTGRTWAFTFGYSNIIDAGGVEFSVSTPGVYRVVGIVTRTTAQEIFSQSVELGHVRVQDQVGVQTFPIAISSESIASALASLGAK